MNEKKSRALLFILGISIGLLVGATTVFVLTPKPSTNGEVSENMIEQIVNKVYGLVSSKKSMQDSVAEKVLEVNKISKPKNLTEAKNPEDNSSKLNDTVTKLAENSNLGYDTVGTIADSLASVATVNLNDDIVVRKDELLATKVVDLINLDYSPSKSTAHNDSILQAVSGIRESGKINENKHSLQVELWKSPINYKGYRLAKNKLVLFGIDENAPLKLFYLNEITYLKYADVFYRLDNYSDYKAFEKVVNLQLIAQLNK